MSENQNISESTKTIQMIEGGKNAKLKSLVPQGQSPKLYLDLVKAQIMQPDKAGKPRADEDLLLFLYTCKRTGLDPLTKQIYAIFRWNTRLGKEVMTIQAGIDGMRLVAQKTGQYAGQDDIKYSPEDETSKYPTKATATVYKLLGGLKVAFTATVRWSEYVQIDKNGMPLQMWERMPYSQLGKCAEALALRKGFPNELSGIYSEEEMAQSGNPLSGLPTPEKFDKSREETLGSPEAANVKDQNVETKTDGEKVTVEVPTDVVGMRKQLENENKK